MFLESAALICSFPCNALSGEGHIRSFLRDPIILALDISNGQHASHVILMPEIRGTLMLIKI